MKNLNVKAFLKQKKFQFLIGLISVSLIAGTVAIIITMNRRTNNESLSSENSVHQNISAAAQESQKIFGKFENETIIVDWSESEQKLKFKVGNKKPISLTIFKAEAKKQGIKNTEQWINFGTLIKNKGTQLNLETDTNFENLVEESSYNVAKTTLSDESIKKYGNLKNLDDYKVTYISGGTWEIKTADNKTAITSFDDLKTQLIKQGIAKTEADKIDGLSKLVPGISGIVGFGGNLDLTTYNLEKLKFDYGDWTNPTNYEVQTYNSNPELIIFQIKDYSNKKVKGLTALEARIAEQGGSELIGSYNSEKLASIAKYNELESKAIYGDLTNLDNYTVIYKNPSRTKAENWEIYAGGSSSITTFTNLKAKLLLQGIDAGFVNNLKELELISGLSGKLSLVNYNNAKLKADQGDWRRLANYEVQRYHSNPEFVVFKTKDDRTKTVEGLTALEERIHEQGGTALIGDSVEDKLATIDKYINLKTVANLSIIENGDWTTGNYEVKTYHSNSDSIVFQIKNDQTKKVSGLTSLEARIAEQGGTALTGDTKTKLESIAGYSTFKAADFQSKKIYGNLTNLDNYKFTYQSGVSSDWKIQIDSKRAITNFNIFKNELKKQGIKNLVVDHLNQDLSNIDSDYITLGSYWNRIENTEFHGSLNRDTYENGKRIAKIAKNSVDNYGDLIDLNQYTVTYKKSAGTRTEDWQIQVGGESDGKQTINTIIVLRTQLIAQGFNSVQVGSVTSLEDLKTKVTGFENNLNLKIYNETKKVVENAKVQSVVTYGDLTNLSNYIITYVFGGTPDWEIKTAENKTPITNFNDLRTQLKYQLISDDEAIKIVDWETLTSGINGLTGILDRSGYESAKTSITAYGDLTDLNTYKVIYKKPSRTGVEDWQIQVGDTNGGKRIIETVTELQIQLKAQGFNSDQVDSVTSLENINNVTNLKNNLNLEIYNGTKKVVENAKVQSVGTYGDLTNLSNYIVTYVFDGTSDWEIKTADDKTAITDFDDLQTQLKYQWISNDEATKIVDWETLTSGIHGLTGILDKSDYEAAKTSVETYGDLTDLHTYTVTYKAPSELRTEDWQIQVGGANGDKQVIETVAELQIQLKAQGFNSDQVDSFTSLENLKTKVINLENNLVLTLYTDAKNVVENAKIQSVATYGDLTNLSNYTVTYVFGGTSDWEIKTNSNKTPITNFNDLQTQLEFQGISNDEVIKIVDWETLTDGIKGLAGTLIKNDYDNEKNSVDTYGNLKDLSTYAVTYLPETDSWQIKIGTNQTITDLATLQTQLKNQGVNHSNVDSLNANLNNLNISTITELRGAIVWDTYNEAKKSVETYGDLTNLTNYEVTYLPKTDSWEIQISSFDKITNLIDLKAQLLLQGINADSANNLKELESVSGFSGILFLTNYNFEKSKTIYGDLTNLNNYTVTYEKSSGTGAEDWQIQVSDATGEKQTINTLVVLKTQLKAQGFDSGQVDSINGLGDLQNITDLKKGLDLDTYNQEKSKVDNGDWTALANYEVKTYNSNSEAIVFQIKGDPTKIIVGLTTLEAIITEQDGTTLIGENDLEKIEKISGYTQEKSKTDHGDWTNPVNYQVKKYNSNSEEVIFQIKSNPTKTIKGLTTLETRIAEQGGTALIGSKKEKLANINKYNKLKADVIDSMIEEGDWTTGNYEVKTYNSNSEAIVFQIKSDSTKTVTGLTALEARISEQGGKALIGNTETKLASIHKYTDLKVAAIQSKKAAEEAKKAAEKAKIQSIATYGDLTNLDNYKFTYQSGASPNWRIQIDSKQSITNFNTLKSELKKQEIRNFVVDHINQNLDNLNSNYITYYTGSYNYRYQNRIENTGFRGSLNRDAYNDGKRIARIATTSVDTYGDLTNLSGYTVTYQKPSNSRHEDWQIQIGRKQVINNFDTFKVQLIAQGCDINQVGLVTDLENLKTKVTNLQNNLDLTNYNNIKQSFENYGDLRNLNNYKVTYRSGATPDWEIQIDSKQPITNFNTFKNELKKQGIRSSVVDHINQNLKNLNSDYIIYYIDSYYYHQRQRRIENTGFHGAIVWNAYNNAKNSVNNYGDLTNLRTYKVTYRSGSTSDWQIQIGRNRVINTLADLKTQLKAQGFNSDQVDSVTSLENINNVTNLQNNLNLTNYNNAKSKANYGDLTNLDDYQVTYVSNGPTHWQVEIDGKTPITDLNTLKNELKKQGANKNAIDGIRTFEAFIDLFTLSSIDGFEGTLKITNYKIAKQTAENSEQLASSASNQPSNTIISDRKNPQSLEIVTGLSGFIPVLIMGIVLIKKLLNKFKKSSRK